MILQKISMLKSNFLSYLRSSYWFVPLMMSLAAILLAILAISIDHWLGSQWLSFSGWFLNDQPQGARIVLATIAGSMITVAGVTFSMTLVAVSFALGQIGPRLIQNFMKDRVNQITLGMFISTFLYCIVILRSVSTVGVSGESLFVPHVGIFIAMLLATTSIAILIYFIHHIQKSINISEILRNIGMQLTYQIGKLASTEETSEKKMIDKSVPAAFHECIISKANGYVHAIDIESLLKLAVKRDCIIKVNTKLGMFVSQTSPLLYVNKKLEASDKEICLDSITIGHERSQEKDIYFLSDQIAEIIIRALSPGINDPFTAISGINWIRCAIEDLSKKTIAHSNIYDQIDNLRIITHQITLTKFINRIFGEIRSYVSCDSNTVSHTLFVIKDMIQNNTDPVLINLLHLHANYFHNTAIDNLNSKQDKEMLSKHVAEINALKNNKPRKSR